MTKVDKVKEKIIETSLYLFNTNGITYTSIQDIMTATELSKGAIYRRFKNKEEIVLLAYDKSGEIMWGIFIKKWKIKRQQSINPCNFPYISRCTNNPPIAGGCPLLNSAIESTGVFPELQSAAKRL